MVKKTNILFICKHNLFRSQVAENLFNKLNKNKKYKADSAGVISWNKRALANDIAYKVEKKICKKHGIKLKSNSKGLNFSLLDKTDILVIVADNVSTSIFKGDKSFNGKILVWKIPDVKAKNAKKEKIASHTIEYIEKKVKDFIKKLK